LKPLAIVGNGPTRKNTRHYDSDWDTWATNNHPFLWEKPVTALFEMHPEALVTGRYPEDYQEWLRQPHDFPIYMHTTNPEIPACVPYPHDEIMSYQGDLLIKGTEPIRNYAPETTPYMLALALHLGYRHIELHGIDHNKTKELPRRDGVFFWLGILHAHKVKVIIPEDSPLISEHIYPFI